MLNLCYFRRPWPLNTFLMLMENKLFAISLVREAHNKSDILFISIVVKMIKRGGGFIPIMCDIRFICIISGQINLYSLVGRCQVGVNSELVSQLMPRPVSISLTIALSPVQFIWILEDPYYLYDIALCNVYCIGCS